MGSSLLKGWGKVRLRLQVGHTMNILMFDHLVSRCTGCMRMLHQQHTLEKEVATLTNELWATSAYLRDVMHDFA